MNVARGPDDTGSAGLHCGTCHQQNNYESSGVPGAEGWRQAPARMAWEGLSVGGLCRTIRDPKAGAMQPQQLVDHFHTSLVMWAWMPGSNARGDTRSTPPLSFDEFIALTRKWVASGAACPR
jgi:hypothetical protein